jgi:transcriptional regulator GlxA family with amidase domain
MSPLRVGILVFDDVEELDFVGPWEVLGMAARLVPGSLNMRLISLRGGSIRAAYGLKIEASDPVDASGRLDLLIVPGGKGARALLKEGAILDFIRRAHAEGTVVASVCTGALVLASAGLLDGRRATTHWAALDDLRAYPKVSVEHQRVIDLGKVVTSAGISAGIDMSLHFVSRFLGLERAREVANRLEYRWEPGEG